MGACIAYGVILEKENHDKILDKILTALPVEEQRFLYLGIYADEYRAYLAYEKLEVEALDIESPDFKREAFVNLAERDAIYDYIDKKYPLLRVQTIRHGEISSIVVNKSHRFLDEYGPVSQGSSSTAELEQLSAAIAELELEVTPQWFYWTYSDD
jgi:hypothetical protein